MKLGLLLGYSGAQMKLPVEKIQQAEALGFDSVWTSESYGSDATSALAYLAAVTNRIRLGTCIMQLAARPPATAAMQAGTIDALSGGNRFVAGLGVSGPQIVEGWYGQPWGKPYWRIKDYVEIMRKIFEREEPVTHEGREISLPYTGEGALGIGKPLKSILHMNKGIPIWLGTGTETNIKLTAHVADGWFPLTFVPGMLEMYQPWLEEGFKRAGNGKSMKDFEIQANVTVDVTNDVQAGLDKMKPNIALYVGGMGAKGKNFHNDMMVRRGYPEAAQKIQELFMAGHKEEAIAAVPDDYCDESGLIGPTDRIRERYKAWESSGATGLTLSTFKIEAMELMAEVTGSRDRLNDVT